MSVTVQKFVNLPRKTTYRRPGSLDVRSSISYVICLVHSIGAVNVMEAQPSERVLVAAVELAELIGNYEAHELHRGELKRGEPTRWSLTALSGLRRPQASFRSRGPRVPAAALTHGRAARRPDSACKTPPRADQ